MFALFVEPEARWHADLEYLHPHDAMSGINPFGLCVVACEWPPPRLPWLCIQVLCWHQVRHIIQSATVMIIAADATESRVRLTRHSIGYRSTCPPWPLPLKCGKIEHVKQSAKGTS